MNWIQLPLFPLPKVNYFRPVPAVIHNMPVQLTYAEWVRRNKLPSHELNYVEYLHIYHTEQILWERWYRNAQP